MNSLEKVMCFCVSVRIEWDLYVTAIVWLIWHERNSRIFLPKYKFNSSILAFVRSFVAFWLKNRPAKQWRTSVRRKGQKGVTGQKVMKNRHDGVAPSGDTSQNTRGSEDAAQVQASCWDADGWRSSFEAERSTGWHSADSNKGGGGDHYSGLAFSA